MGSFILSKVSNLIPYKTFEYENCRYTINQCDWRVLFDFFSVAVDKILLSLLMLTLGFNQTYGSAIARTGLFV